MRAEIFQRLILLSARPLFFVGVQCDLCRRCWKRKVGAVPIWSDEAVADLVLVDMAVDFSMGQSCPVAICFDCFDWRVGWQRI